MESLPSLEHFKEQLHSTFRVPLTPEVSTTLELYEIDDRGGYRDSNDAHRPSFSLFFRGPKEFQLPQSIYRLEHQALGSFELFVVPVGIDQHGMQFEAVIN